MANDLDVGDPAPDFALPTDGGGHARLADLKGMAVVLYFDPKDDNLGLHRRGDRLQRAQEQVRRRGRSGRRGLARQRGEPRQVPQEAQSRRGFGRRPGAEGDRSLWGVEGEDHVRPEIFRRQITFDLIERLRREMRSERDSQFIGKRHARRPRGGNHESELKRSRKSPSRFRPFGHRSSFRRRLVLCRSRCPVHRPHGS